MASSSKVSITQGDNRSLGLSKISELMKNPQIQKVLQPLQEENATQPMNVEDQVGVLICHLNNFLMRHRQPSDLEPSDE